MIKINPEYQENGFKQNIHLVTWIKEKQFEIKKSILMSNFHLENFKRELASSFTTFMITT